MCGITGIFHLQSKCVDPNILQGMTDSLRHRGPDHGQLFFHQNLGLGHRRLSVIDLSKQANQPFVSLDERYVLVFNGTIYNYKELRSELKNLGVHFKTQSDTEVLLAAFQRWNADCLPKLNGMFAFAIWDRQAKKLFLARDRYGIKPLYYALNEKSFVFASEIKAILKSNEVASKVNPEALLEYFTFQNLFTDKTLFQGVKILPAGCYLLVDAHSGLKFERYWDFSFEEPEKPKSEQEYLEELKYLFDQAVQRQFVSDVEIGSYLSGGIDSGSITALAAENFPGLKTFTCGFDMGSASGLEMGFDERKKAQALADLFSTEHFSTEVRSGDMEKVLPDLTWHLEDLRVGQSYPNYYVAQMASEKVKVVLAGTGGDELFAGYPWRYYRAVVNESFEQYIDKYYLFWQRLIPNSQIREVFSPVWPQVKNIWTRDIFRDVFQSHAQELNRPEDYVNHSLYFEAKTFLHGLLVVEDRLNMAHGLESRVPFLDNDLVDFAMKLPASLKLGNLGEVVRLNENDLGHKVQKYYRKTKDGKLLLRQVLGHYVPEEVMNREKQGFSGPDASWFKGESIEFVRRELLQKSNPLYDYLDFQSVKGLIDEHLQGSQNRRLFIWSLLSFGSWLKHFG